MNIHQKIKRLRMENDWTQEDLALKLGVPRSTLAKWELKITPDYETIKKIAVLFNVSTDYILGATDDKQGKADISFALVDGRTINDLNEMLIELSPSDQVLIYDMIKSLSKRMKK